MGDTFPKDLCMKGIFKQVHLENEIASPQTFYSDNICHTTSALVNVDFYLKNDF